MPRYTIDKGLLILKPQLKFRFTWMNKIINSFFCSNSQELLLSGKDDLFASANSLAVQYPDNLSPEQQLRRMGDSIKDITELLYLKHNYLLPNFPVVAMTIKL
jgi:hypothetical protein